MIRRSFLTYACMFPAALLAVAGASDFAAADDGDQVAIQEHFRGSCYGSEMPAGEQIIEDVATWEEVWQQVNANLSPAPDLPALDFDTQVVLVAVMEEQNSGGYSIRFTNLLETDTEIEAHVLRRSPPPGSITPAVMTQPYEIIVIAKPEKPIVFVSEDP